MRLLYNGYTWIILGAAVVLWHGFNMLRRQPSSAEGFVVIRRSESAWALLIGVAMIGVGCLLLVLFPANHFLR